MTADELDAAVGRELITWRITRRGTQLLLAVPHRIGHWIIVRSATQPRIFYRPDRIGD